MSLPTKFKQASPNLRVLTNELDTHASTYGWTPILTVPGAAGNPALMVHSQYNAITADRVKTHVNTYIDLDERNQQNDYQLYVCLNATIDEATKKMMSGLKKDYTCGAAENKQSGVLFLKVLFAKSAPQAKAMATHARTKIMNLHVYMTEKAKDDIGALHDHVKACIAQLESVNQTSSDIETALFKAYAACKDDKFRRYTERMQEEYNEDVADVMNFEVIMERTDNVYTTRIADETWLKPSEDQAEIHALRGQVEALTNANRRAPNPPRTPNTPPPANTGGGGGRATGKRKAKFDRLQPEWRKVKPKQGESHHKKVNGVDWFFCIHHGYWVQHKSDDCRDKPEAAATTTESDIRAAIGDVGVEHVDDDSVEM